MKDKVKKYLKFKRPRWEDKVVNDIAASLIEDDFPKNNIITISGAIRFIDYAFSLSKD